MSRDQQLPDAGDGQDAPAGGPGARYPDGQDPRSGGPGTRPGQLALALLVAGVVGWAASSWWLGQGNAVPVRAVLGMVLDVVFSLTLLGAALWVWRTSRARGRGVSAREERIRHRAPSPQTARVIVVAAIAAAWAGAVLAGAFSGLFVAALPNADVPSVREDVVRTGIQVGTFGLLAVSGQVSQWLCRVPPEEGDDEGGGPRRQPSPGRSTPALGRTRDERA
ncbi:DUF3180 family protein [Kytococcus sedentarius]|uniref:DUF3180 family protein n=1 Tax=Kytococcus sedentarius TaxID=1276 RepID=UPI0035BC2446